MAEYDFNRGTYGPNYDMLGDNELEEYFWTLGEDDPDETDEFIDLETIEDGYNS